MKPERIKQEHVHGYAIDGDELHYKANCPKCDSMVEYIGWFDPQDRCTCPECSATFYIRRLWIDEANYTE